MDSIRHLYTVLRTKSVTKKEMNKCMAEYMILEGVVIRNTPLLKSPFIDDGKPIRQKVHFLDDTWD